MGVNTKGIKKINSDMSRPEYFNLSGFELAVYSSKGSRPKGEKNEDSCGFISPSPSQVAVIVSDGLGGHNLGDQASKIVVNTVLGRNTNRRRPFNSAQVVSKMEKAHQRIIDLKADAGATVVAAVVEGNSLWFYSVGDSLGFLMSKKGEISYKTFEHSVVGFATESGLMAEKEAQQHDQSNIILNALGFSDSRMESSFKLAVKAGETLILCTDGLTELLLVDEIREYFKQENLQESVDSLFEQIKVSREKKGVFDDLALVVCRVKDSQ